MSETLEPSQLAYQTDQILVVNDDNLLVSVTFAGDMDEIKVSENSKAFTIATLSDSSFCSTQISSYLDFTYSTFTLTH